MSIKGRDGEKTSLGQSEEEEDALGLQDSQLVTEEIKIKRQHL